MERILRLLRKLRDKYRLVILDEKTYEEKVAIRLSRLNVIVLGSTVFVLVISVFVSLVVFTPLKQYIPGYADVNLRRDLVRLYLAADSLERSLSQREMLLDNFRQVIEGDIKNEVPDTLVGPQPMVNYDIEGLSVTSPFDSILRAQIARENVDVRIGIEQERKSFHGAVFFQPVTGRVVRSFTPNSRNYGLGLNTSKDELVKATLDGSVIYVGYSLEQAWVVGIQHGQNMVSWYKRLNNPLKKTGNFVRAGEVVGVTGPVTGRDAVNFEFEIWYNGIAIDPAEYLNF